MDARTTRRSPEITLGPFPDTTMDTTLLLAAVERYSAFLGVPTTISP
ncbi:hypothetical protein [Actinacidiphila oryziradicis]|nr:hypothetical protein [Actinacidiphila oryziradicis]